MYKCNTKIQNLQLSMDIYKSHEAEKVSQDHSFKN